MSGQRPGHADHVADPLEQPGLELGVVPLGRHAATSGRPAGPGWQYVRHRPHAHPAGPGDGPVGQALLVLQSQDFTNLSHQ